MSDFALKLRGTWAGAPAGSQEAARQAVEAAAEACAAELEREAVVCRQVSEQSTDRTIRNMNGGADIALRKMAARLRGLA